MTDKGDIEVVAACGNCGSEDVHFTTCDEVWGTGHEWAIAMICHGCQWVTVVDDGCHVCGRGRETGGGESE